MIYGSPGNEVQGAMVTEFINNTACLFGIQSLCFASSLSPGDWAAWAQFIGSLVATFTAIGVVRWQLKSEERRRGHDELQRLRVIWTLVYHCRVEMQASAEFDAKNDNVPVEPQSLRSKVEALRAIPLANMPDSDAALAVLTAVEAYDNFLNGTALGSLPTVLNRAFVKRAAYISHSNALLDNLRFCEDVLRQNLRDRGSNTEQERTYVLNGQPFPPR
jgi:hypothetical protein